MPKRSQTNALLKSRSKRQRVPRRFTDGTVPYDLINLVNDDSEDNGNRGRKPRRDEAVTNEERALAKVLCHFKADHRGSNPNSSRVLLLPNHRQSHHLLSRMRDRFPFLRQFPNTVAEKTTPIADAVVSLAEQPQTSKTVSFESSEISPEILASNPELPVLSSKKLYSGTFFGKREEGRTDTPVQPSKRGRVNMDSYVTKLAVNLGWNCFDVAIGLAKNLFSRFPASLLAGEPIVLFGKDERIEQKEAHAFLGKISSEAAALLARQWLVNFALNNSSDLGFRKLLAPEIRHAAAATVVGDSHALPEVMRTDELKHLVLEYQDSHEMMQEAVRVCNDALGHPEGSRLSLEELDRYFEESKNQEMNRAAYEDFQAARKTLFTPHEKAFADYCEREAVYRTYVESYYGTKEGGQHDWFVFQRQFNGEKNTSMMDIAARYIQHKVIVHDMTDEIIYQTEESFDDKEVHIRYNGSNHFTADGETYAADDIFIDDKIIAESREIFEKLFLSINEDEYRTIVYELSPYEINWIKLETQFARLEFVPNRFSPLADWLDGFHRTLDKIKDLKEQKKFIEALLFKLMPHVNNETEKYLSIILRYTKEKFPAILISESHVIYCSQMSSQGWHK